MYIDFFGPNLVLLEERREGIESYGISMGPSPPSVVIVVVISASHASDDEVEGGMAEIEEEEEEEEEMGFNNC
jgi:hypothetical protein